MNSQQENLTSKEKGLIKHLSTRNYQLDSSDLLNKQLMEKSSKTIMKYGGVDAIKEFRIDYGKSEKGWCPTTIRDYTNKKGFVSKAHYTKFGKYYGSVKKLGNEPVNHFTWINITDKTFDIYWTVNIENGLLIPVEQPRRV